ncbi:MAG TPA: S8 family serine peptidase [Usitatibacter sp.]|nr:S8 family serine peptidase [Usitatibacter sp.]
MHRLARAAILLFAFLFPLAASAYSQPGLNRLSAVPLGTGTSDGVATFGGAMPSAAQIAGLQSLGLQVQKLDRLPLALLRGPRAAMIEAVTSRGLATDVYPNDRLVMYSKASNVAIGADQVQSMGYDGAGVGVAIVDSGIDATHPDLALRVKHNVKMVDTGLPTGPIILPMDATPVNNSDTSSGHGTHVAGIVAADNTDGKVMGVAPGANLIGYGMGDAVFVFGAVIAYDHLIGKRAEWGIKVVNNSWGSSFRLFDPAEPINVATKAAHDAGITVVFAAGNSATEMSLNPYSAAPWVISTGNGTLNHQRNTTSSGGLEFDNSLLAALPAGDEKHMAFSGDRIGLYHPTVSAPGTNIVSTGALTGVAVTSNPDRTATATGTSMASPHIAGVAALMLQARPTLTPGQVKAALQVTASLMPDLADASKVQPFWQAGYGYANAKAAVDLVGRKRFTDKALARMQKDADVRVLADRDYKVQGTDYFTFTAAPATVNGTPDTRSYSISVPATTRAIKALVSYPSLGYVGANVFDYSITLVDAAGRIVATSAADPSAGMSNLFADLTVGTYTYGTWTVNVRGELGAQDQDTLMGILVSVAVHQLAPQARVRPAMALFTPTGSASFYFTPGAAGLASSPEGCNLQVGGPKGGLAATPSTGACQSGSMGWAFNYGIGDAAVFTSAPLAAPLTIGGTTTLRFYLTDPAQPAWTVAQNPGLAIEIDAVDANGELLLAAGAAEWDVCNGNACNTGPQPVGGTYVATIPPITLPPGSRLSVVVYESAAVASASRTVWGGAGLGASYSDAGITFTTGTLQ